MPYSKQTWQDGNPAYGLTAARMGYLEDGISEVDGRVLSVESVRTIVAAPTGDPTTDTNAIQNAINALPNGRGVVQLRDGTYTCDGLSLATKKNIVLRGVASPTKSGGVGTVLMFVGTGVGSFINATETEGLLFEDLDIRYNNSGFTGNMVDLRGSATGVITNHIVFRRVFLGAQPTLLTSASSLVRMDRSVVITFEDGGCLGGTRAMTGHDGTSYANAVLCKRWLFQGQGAAPVLNPGEGWTFLACTGEPLTSNKVGLVECDPGITASGMAIIGGWFGDPSVAGGTWIKWCGMGLTITGARMGCDDAGGTVLELVSNGCEGVSLHGNKFKTCTVLNFGSTSGHKDIHLGPNGYENATKFAGTPSGVLASAGSYVTALPASPRDGEVIDFAADAANGVIWRLRYRAGSGSAYKWEFLGGPPLYAEVTTLETTTSATYVALATAGPSIALPLGGDYMVTQGCNVNSSTAGAFTFMSYSIGATAAVDGDATSGKSAAAGAPHDALTRTRRKTGLSAVTLAARYRVTAGTGEWGNRWMSVTPVRVG